MTTSSLAKPNTLQIVVGTCITVLRDSFTPKTYPVPLNIGKFTLISSIQKHRGYNYSFSIGLYEHNGKKYFIKQWSGRIHDLNYYSLVNEYRVAALLAKKINVPGSDVRIPTIIEYVESPTSLALVFEYVEGKSLSACSQKIRSATLYACVDILSDISNQLTENERREFSLRSNFFTTISFFPLAFLVLVFNIHHASLICSLFVKGLLTFFKRPSNTQHNTIAHRDLDASNVIIKGRIVYITDFESVVLTPFDYDLVRLTTTPDIDTIPPKYTKQLQKPENEFLKIYILFHLVISAQATSDVREKYFGLLKNLKQYEL